MNIEINNTKLNNAEINNTEVNINKIDQIKDWLKSTETKYDNHQIYFKGLIRHDLVEESKRLFVEKVTLRKVLEILEK